MGLLSGKKILVTGLLSNRSIAYGIARAARREGAELAFTYVGDRFKDRVSNLAKDFQSDAVYPCDVASDEQIAAIKTGGAAASVLGEAGAARCSPSPTTW